MAECKKCIHEVVCESAKSCDGRVPGCKHFKEQKKGRMDMQEKLVELLWDAFELTDNELPTMEQVADHLIANGVTVQEKAKLYWKPVKPGEWYLTCSACDSHLGCREDANFCPECGAKFVYPKAVAPQPPKGE